MNNAGSGLIGCAIMSNNRLAGARVLATSFKRHHPDSRFVVLLCDKIDGYFDPYDEPFEVLEIQTLGVYGFQNRAMYYDAFELTLSLKPVLCRYLFDTTDCEKILYFDTDILVTGSHDGIIGALDEHPVILTPHISKPLEGDAHYKERAILMAGLYNMGFYALRRSPVTDDLLRWWSTHLERDCIVDQASGYHADQRWMDLAPILFRDVFVTRDPAYNTAHWNLQERSVRQESGRWLVNGTQMANMHFSGFDPLQPLILSRHSPDKTFDHFPSLRPLFENYANLLLDAGYETSKNFPYAFDFFTDGTPITRAMRLYYRSVGNLFWNPFFAGPKAFLSDTKESATERPPMSLRDFLRKRHSYEPYQRLIKRLKSAVGEDVFYTIAFWRKKRYPLRDAKPKMFEAKGMNIVGLIRGEVGVGEAVRGLIRGAQAAGIPIAANAFQAEMAVSFGDKEFESIITKEHPYDVNCIAVNPESLEYFTGVFGNDYLQDSYNIAQWGWEVEQALPELWKKLAPNFDELWVYSHYVREALEKELDLPIIRVPLCVQNPGRVEPDREKFGLPREAFVFVFCFDMQSSFLRKNPYDAIQAFRLAFAQDEPVVLVLKALRGEMFGKQMQELHDLANGHDVRFITKNMARADVWKLMASADAYVSLHRSEGFGLTMAEAMMLEKPVIATGYSGNMDFMDTENSYPVAFERVRVEISNGYYPENGLWAQPNIQEAARLMRHVYEHRDEAKAKGQKARATILENFSPQATGTIIAERLEFIRTIRR